MNKKKWILCILPVFAVWGIDQMTKMWAIDFTALGPVWFKLGGVVMHHNSGAMLGMFSDLPPLLRIVSLATSGAFLIFVYALIQFFLSEGLMVLRVGLSVLLGGILGNVTDRILYGSVIDFLIIGKGTFISPAFNMADALQWVGYGMIVYMILFKGHLIWHEENKRNRLWIDPAYQLKYSVILASVSIWFSMIFGVYSYTFIKVMISDFIVHGTASSSKYLNPFILILFILACMFSLSLFLIGRHLSHRSVGPIYGFKRYIDDIKNGENYTFKLREKDEFKQLESIASEYKKDLRELEKLKKQISDKES